MSWWDLICVPYLINFAAVRGGSPLFNIQEQSLLVSLFGDSKTTVG